MKQKRSITKPLKGVLALVLGKIMISNNQKLLPASKEKIVKRKPVQQYCYGDE